MNDEVRGAGWQDYTELKGMLRALGDIARLNMVRVLAGGGEVNVTDLAVALRISQPLVSWHLSVLRRHGIVHTERRGREVYCSLDVERYHACLRMLGAIVGDAAPARAGADGAPAPAPQSPQPQSSGVRTRRATTRARRHAPAPR